MPVDLSRPQYFTPSQVAVALGVRRQAVHQMIASGRLVATIVTPYGRLFARGEVERVKRLREAGQRTRRSARTPVP